MAVVHRLCDAFFLFLRCVRLRLRLCWVLLRQLRALIAWVAFRAFALAFALTALRALVA